MTRFTEHGPGRPGKGLIDILATAAAAAVLATPVMAAGSIDNSVVAAASQGGTALTSEPVTQSVPLADAVLAITVANAATIDDGGDGKIDGGDVIRFTVSVRNDSNVTITGVAPGESGIAFADAAGTGRFGAFAPAGPVSLVPGAAQDFTVTYTLAAIDVYRAAAIENGVVASVKIDAKGPRDTPLSGNGTAQATIPATPALAIAKTAVLQEANGNTEDGKAEVGDTITYTYVVTNTGNVALDGVKIVDTHEGTEIDSSSATSSAKGPFDEAASTADPLGKNADAGVDGVYDTLGAGGAVTFTFVHVVTQAEFDAQ